MLSEMYGISVYENFNVYPRDNLHTLTEASKKTRNIQGKALSSNSETVGFDDRFLFVLWVERIPVLA